MSQSGKLTPNLDPETTKQINLSVLQRFDRHIEEILFTAAHVALYEFDTESCQWGRKKVEGPLFVVKRNTQPIFQFIVMNRLRTDNWVENLIEDFEFEIQRPYLLSRNASQEVNGIWFFNSNECEEVGNLLSRILSICSKSPPAVNPGVVPVENKYEETAAIPTILQTRGGGEHHASAISTTSQIPQNQNLMDLFNAAINKGRNNPTIPSHRYFPNNPSDTTFPVSSEIPSLTYSSAGVCQSSSAQTLNHEFSNLLRLNYEILTTAATELIKPSSFYTPPQSLESITVSAPQPPPPNSQQHPNSIRILDLFPPATLPQSLIPPLASPSVFGFDRDKVRDALLTVAQIAI
ncbi:PREDICTED: mRNA-decapping enzyme-like protein isoform X2 [Tarenaya hassleriana]|uniref:mRNA-decapping enzyme-like protein isoform X2 n=1 Tax=Tarenaya hassleriana TaxID=28532 RepID=UPI00053C16A9|nr:PREDICTED: mRNA-decapping enzyme-like protein isoform X2 [Tarenaya hassleriana]